MEVKLETHTNLQSDVTATVTTVAPPPSFSDDAKRDFESMISSVPQKTLEKMWKKILNKPLPENAEISNMQSEIVSNATKVL